MMIMSNEFNSLQLVKCTSPSLLSSSPSSLSSYSNGLFVGVNKNNNMNNIRRQPKRSNIQGNSRFTAQISASNTNRQNNYTYFEEKDSSIMFSHMAVNVYSGYIYVGAINNIYQLKLNSSQLSLETRAIMGPQEDSSDCPPTKRCPPNVSKRLSNYYNKALVIDNQHQWLISCGSLYQGACVVHNWNNVSNIIHQPTESVAANNATASTVAFIAAGPPPHKQVLYVGTTYTQGNYRSDVPAVASRSLFENSKCEFFFLIILLFHYE